MKITSKENFRVVITPDMFLRTTDRQKQDACELLAKDIKRHIDGFDDIEVTWDTVERCEYCKEIWETDAEGSPLCCNKACEEHDGLKAFAPELAEEK